MSEYEKSLYYRWQGDNNKICLYTDPDEVANTSNKIAVRHNGNIVYAPIGSTGTSISSNIFIRLSDNTYSILHRKNLSTPEVILSHIRSNQHNTLYNVGDTFEIKLNGYVSYGISFSNATYYAVVIGKNHNASLETAGNPSMTFAIIKRPDESKLFSFCNTTETSRETVTNGATKAVHNNCYAKNYGYVWTGGQWFELVVTDGADITGGWVYSFMRAVVLPNFFNCLSSDWQNVIGYTTKYTDNFGNKSNTNAHVTTTSDRLFLVSEYELMGVRKYANTYEQNYQQQYSFFANSSNRSFYQHGNTSKTASAMTRSPYYNSSANFCVKGANGMETRAANVTCSFFPCFTLF